MPRTEDSVGGTLKARWVEMMVGIIVAAISGLSPESTVGVPMSRAPRARRTITEQKWLSTSQIPEMSTIRLRAPRRSTCWRIDAQSSSASSPLKSPWTGTTTWPQRRRMGARTRLSPITT